MKAQERMFKALLILFAIGLIILALSEMGKSQTVSFSPTSVPLWGQIEHTAKASVEYKGFELVAVKAMKTMYDHYGTHDMYSNISSQGELFNRPGEYSGYYFGLFYSPLAVEYGNLSANGGVGLWNRKFPTKNGENIHFKVSVAYQVHEHFSVEYEHLSNGFGVINRLNPGIDHFSVTYHF